MAHSGISRLRVIRPLYGTKRTSASAAPMSQNDPERTSAARLIDDLVVRLSAECATLKPG